MAPPTPTVDALLAEARARGLERLDARVLLAHHLGRSTTWLHAHGDEPVVSAEAVRTLFQRRREGQPIAYLTGQREFHGLWLRVTPAVLDPRPDTETLVDWALDLLAGPLGEHAAPRVADLGTGSGAIALALAQACPRARVTGTDRSAEALAVARANGERLALPVTWSAGCWFGALETPQDLIVSNPPYLAADDPHLPALHAEPRSALVAAERGLADLFHLVDTAGSWLRPGGWLLLEHGHDQGDAVARRLQAAGFTQVDHRQDLAGHVRCSGACWQLDTPAGER